MKIINLRKHSHAASVAATILHTIQSPFQPTIKISPNDADDEEPSPAKRKRKEGKIPIASTEPENDQELTSTVENKPFAVWSGCLKTAGVARLNVAAYEITGNASDLEEHLGAELDVVGRINPDTVWDYIDKIKQAGNYDILVLKLQTAYEEENMHYYALYTHLSSRNRVGVVKVCNTTKTTHLRDFFIVPLAAQSFIEPPVGFAALPAVLQPLGVGRCTARTHLLIAVIVRVRRHRTPIPPLPLKH